MHTHTHPHLRAHAYTDSYLDDGEPYLNTAYGFGANLWDGTAHWALYLIMIYGLASRNPALFRPVYLYWAGSIIFSLCILMPGAAVGCFSHIMDYSAFLNVPFILLPVYFLKRIFDTPRPLDPQARGSAWVDALFAALFAMFIFILGVRFAAGNDSNLPVAVAWREAEPTLVEPSRFFTVTSTVQFYYGVPIMGVLVTCLLFGASRTQRGLCTDLAVFLAGGIAESQFCYVLAAVHHLTADKFRVTCDHTQFWQLNIGLVLLTHALAVYLVRRKALAGVF